MNASVAPRVVVALAVAATATGCGSDSSDDPVPAPSGSGDPKRAEVARIKRLVVEYGRSPSSKETCRLESERKKRRVFGDPAKCHYSSNPHARRHLTIVHYRFLKVKIRERSATAYVTGELGRERISLVKSRARGWLVDAVYRYNPGTGKWQRTG